MPTERQPLHIAVVGSVPELNRIDTSVLVDDEDYRPERHDFASVEALWSALPETDVDAVVVDADALTDPDQFRGRLRRSAPFCRSLLVADPSSGEMAATAAAEGVAETVVRPTDSEAAVELVAQSLIRLLFPRPLAGEPRPRWLAATLRGIYGGSSVPFFVADRDYRVRYFNQRVNELNRKIFGENLKIGQSIYELLPRDDRAGFSVHFDRALGGERISIQKDVDNVDSPGRWHEYVYEPVRDRRGAVVGVGISIREIDHQKRAEKKLEESEARFWTIFQGAQFGMVITDNLGRVVHANPNFEDWIGRKEVALKGEPLLWYLHADDRGEAGDAFDAVHSGERPSVRFETRFVNAEDSVLWADVVAWPIRDEEQRIQHVIAIVVDITEQKEFEKQMQQAEKMQAVGRLASGFAHEFNNLLMAIVGYAHAIGSEVPEDSPVRGDVEKIQSLSEQGGQLTRQLLTYSRHQESNPVELDLNDAIRDMSEMLERLFDRGIALELELSEELPHIEADAGQIDQMLMNLALNARDAMPEGGRLTITTERLHVNSPDPDDSVSRDLGPGTYTVLRVRDTGIGMDEETQSHIFEPFYSTKEVGQGTGLGLALVYGVVDQCNGQIDVESALGEGSEFTLFFPAHSSENGADNDLARERYRTPDDLERPPGATILIVDDEASVRNALARHLEERGYRVHTAASPSEARDLFRRHAGDIDLLVADIVMPNQPGTELAADLSSKYDNLSVLYLTGYSDDELTEWLDAPSARADVLHKPLSHEQIHRRILEKLGTPR